MSYYSPNPHYAPDDFSEARERRERAEAEAGRWFNDATKAQQARYNQRIADIAPYRGSPRWDREREAATREFHETTAAAAELCAETTRELIATGEVSEALSERWDALDLPSYEEALKDAAKARVLFDASKGGNVRGITEDHRFELLQVFAVREAMQAAE